MRFGPKRAAHAQPSLLGEHDRIEHAPQSEATGFQRWTARAQVDALLAHPRIQELWPTGEYVAADPCAGTGQLMRHLDEAAPHYGLSVPREWLANELDPCVVPSYRVADDELAPRIRWFYGDAARLSAHPEVAIVPTNLPWFGVFARLVGHWRAKAFPGALIVALCDDQERTRGSSRAWLEDENMPALIAQLPGRQHFDGASDAEYPWSCSWYVWRPGERRTTSEVILL